jgi:hypothetical protein
MLFSIRYMSIKFRSAYDKVNGSGGEGAVMSFVALRVLIQFYGGFDIQISPQVPENHRHVLGVSRVLTPADILVRNA